MSAVVHEGDVLAVLRDVPNATYHGCLTDPPYGLSFMGHGWDHGVPSADVWREVIRVLRPGAHLLAFGGTRTFHRLTCAIEDAGFEIRDCIQWLYGSGFPKSKNGVDWGGTALKPAWEPIIVARKPLDGTVAENVQRWGCGGLAIDASRVEAAGRPLRESKSEPSVNALGDGLNGSRSIGITNLGRWPANVILSHSPDCVEAVEAWQCAEGCAVAALDAQSGERKSTLTGRADPSARHAHPAEPSATRASMFGNERAMGGVYADFGGASRFFYCPKASRSERDAGLEEFEAHSRAEATRRKEGSPGSKNAAAGAGGENCRNVHPTVKPIALARYLARLILPPIPDARMLTPFCGSGSEIIGAMQAGWSHVDGIDSWDVAVRISRARIAHWSDK